MPLAISPTLMAIAGLGGVVVGLRYQRIATNALTIMFGQSASANIGDSRIFAISVGFRLQPGMG